MMTPPAVSEKDCPGLVFHPVYSQLSLPFRHRFPIEKYAALYQQLRTKGVGSQYFHQPEPVSYRLLLDSFDHQYIRKLCSGKLEKQAMRRIGFPWSEQLILRTRTAVGGTLLTAHLALQQGLALNLTGGYHHAFADYGSGFCMINDLYLAAKAMLTSPGIDTVLIFDCDVHQGDGTARLAEDTPEIFTVSIHGEKNFPYRKQMSDIDFALPKGTEDAAYLNAIDEALHLALTQARPDAVIYDAGVDIHIDDDLGHLNITTEGVYQRDKLVIDTCRTARLPVAAVIGGGYQRDIAALVEVHMQLFKAAKCF